MVQELLLEPQPSPLHSKQQEEGMDKKMKVSSFYGYFIEVAHDVSNFICIYQSSSDSKCYGKKNLLWKNRLYSLGEDAESWRVRGGITNWSFWEAKHIELLKGLGRGNSWWDLWEAATTLGVLSQTSGVGQQGPELGRRGGHVTEESKFQLETIGHLCIHLSPYWTTKWPLVNNGRWLTSAS